MASFYKQSAEQGRSQGILPIAFADYVKLVEWTGEVLSSAAEPDPAHAPQALGAQQTNPAGWMLAQRGHAIATATALGNPASLQSLAEQRGKRSVRGIGVARCLAG